MRNPQGMTINYSMIVNEDGQQEIGFHYNDTDGIDIDRHYKGDSNEKMLGKLCQDVVTEITKQTSEIKKRKAIEAAKEEETKKAAKAKKTISKKEQVDYIKKVEELEARLKALEEDNRALQLDNEVLNKRIKDNLQAVSAKNIKKEEPVYNDLEEKYNPYKMIEELLSDLGW